MKINRPHLHGINPYKANDMKLTKSKKAQSMQTDKLEISSKAKELSEMTTQTTERSKHVQEIKQQVQAGTYEVNPNKIAESLVKYFQ